MMRISAIAVLLLLSGVARAADTPSPAAPASTPPAEPKAPAASAPVSSIMLWPADLAAIQKAINDHEHPPAAEIEALAHAAAAVESLRPRKPNIYVSAVLDFGDGHWTVWANGLRITPNRQSPLFRIVGVHGDAVDIFVPGEGGGRFVLRPYQTWLSRRQDVVEGIVP